MHPASSILRNWQIDGIFAPRLNSPIGRRKLTSMAEETIFTPSARPPRKASNAAPNSSGPEMSIVWSSIPRRRAISAIARGRSGRLSPDLDSLCIELGREDASTCHVATRPRQARSKPGIHQIVADTDDRKRFGCSLCRAPRRFSIGQDHGSAFTHQCFSESRKPVKLALGQTHVEAYVFAINEPMLRERVA